jgi:hypothetical protein
MGIDLTRLNNLRTGAEQAPEKPTETQTARGEYKTLTKPQTAPETLTEGLEGIHKLQRQADAKKQDIDRSLSIYKEYQHNIIISSQLQTEILKGVKAGEDIYNLFLKACKAISLMTSNSVFYNQLERDIKTIYGQEILNPLAILEHEHREQE